MKTSRTTITGSVSLQNKLGITKFLNDDVPTFDPIHPYAYDQINIPSSPDRKAKAPDGN